MTDWRRLAASLDPPVPEADADKFAPTLENLETAFRKLQRTIPQGADVWTPETPSE